MASEDGVCDTEFKIDNAGKSQVLQHAKGKVHKDLVSSALDNTQPKLSITSTSSKQSVASTSAEFNTLKLYVHTDEVLKPLKLQVPILVLDHVTKYKKRSLLCFQIHIFLPTLN